MKVIDVLVADLDENMFQAMTFINNLDTALA